jgi:hypothetical protein
MDRRMATRHRRLSTGPAGRHAATSGPARLQAGAGGPGGLHGDGRAGWRPDLAVCVALAGLVLGVLVLIPLVRAVAPGPPSGFAAPAQSAPTLPTPAAAAAPHGPLATYRSGTSVVSRGVAYSALSAQRTTGLDLPGPVAGLVHGNLVIVKLELQGVAATASTASVGLVDLVDGAVAYRPLLPVATALSHTRWQTLVLKALRPGATKRVKLIYEVPDAVPTRLTLLIGSHAPGAKRFAIPVASGV